MRIITNTIEVTIQDTQLFRSVAYFMLEVGLLNEAIALFRRVQDKAPAEPQSFLDLGLALYMDVRAQHKKGVAADKFKAQLKEAIAEISKVLTGEWVDRFNEIEWPACIWINWMVQFGKFAGLGDLWPENISRVFYTENFTLDLLVAMGWDTDHTDIDLHVNEPNGNHVYFSNKCGKFSKDFTQGYGPEVYCEKASQKGVYRVSATYYGSNQISQSTGTTSAVLWSVKYYGDFTNEEIIFKMIRLDKNKSEMTVMYVNV